VVEGAAYHVSMSRSGDSEADSAPRVSVAITAFNSEKWLSRALDSVLLQRTDFPIEIVIGDDSSADGTLTIARSYQERNPGLIRVLERTGKLGMQRNYYETFEQCRGRFIAWLDADDYWTDPDKLAVQVDVLESDPSVSACGHFVRWVTPEGEETRKRVPAMPAGRYGLEEIIRNNFLPSPSIMFRRGIYRDLPQWFFDLTELTDWAVLVFAGISGDIVLLDRVMADYMLTPGSAYMSKGSLYRETMDVQFCEQIESVLPAGWQRLARATKGKRYEGIAYLLRKQGDFSASREVALKAFRSPAPMDNVGSKIKSLLIAVWSEAGWKLRGKRNAGGVT
jgi:glycosyltransferase involved in cell wall biosynthesis